MGSTIARFDNVAFKVFRLRPIVAGQVNSSISSYDRIDSSHDGLYWRIGGSDSER